MEFRVAAVTSIVTPLPRSSASRTVMIGFWISAASAKRSDVNASFCMSLRFVSSRFRGFSAVASAVALGSAAGAITGYATQSIGKVRGKRMGETNAKMNRRAIKIITRKPHQRKNCKTDIETEVAASEQL